MLSCALSLGGSAWRPATCSAALLPHFQAFLKSRDEIDDLRALPLLRFRNLDLFSFHFGANDFHEIRAIVVGVFARVERRGQVADELLGHLQLLRSDAGVGRETELASVDQLVG